MNARDLEGTTPLHKASYQGNKECVNVLLENKASIDPVDQVTISWSIIYRMEALPSTTPLGVDIPKYAKYL